MAVIAKTVSFTASPGHLRPLDIQHDLLAVADLIELCFASTMDPDGEQYLRLMRSAARDTSFLRWAPMAAERVGMPLSGFIWEEDGRLVGNLSLIPLSKQGKKVYFIANVAVHPDYRRRGIARALTEAATDYVRSRHVSTTWLQVRADNPNALNLYLSEGFIERARRNTWQVVPGKQERPIEKPGGISVTNRNSSDWELQKTWLNQNYPPEVAWNLPFNANNLKPNLIMDLFRFISGETLHHWAARRNGRLLGMLSFEPGSTLTDNLWLAAPPETEAEVIPGLLPFAMHDLPPIRRLTINYPAGRGEEAFSNAGFEIHQTLIWMEAHYR